MEKVLTNNLHLERDPELGAYEAAGGYQALRKALTLTPQDVQEQVTRSHLKGRGGAGFPTGKKWSFVPLGPAARRPKYLCVNADEMEPGTFKDRLLLEGDPHLLVEGAILAAYAIEAQVAYIFLRGEYVLAARRLQMALAQARAAGYLGKNILGSPYSLEMHLHTSAGRYMCGEETGLLNALEGRRANPRNKPPFPQVVGLRGLPTVVNNVETLCCVPAILTRGPEWFRNLSLTHDDGGTKLYGVAGRVNNPGLWELPMGVTAGELLERAGGMREGYKLRGYLPGGASTGILTDKHLGVKLDFVHPPQVGSRMGTGTMIVLDDRTCPVGLMHNLMLFFARESCGWCTPCRDGLPWAASILRALEEGCGESGDLAQLDRFVDDLGPGRAFCALAPGAMAPLQNALKFFRGDFERHIRDKKCPWR